MFDGALGKNGLGKTFQTKFGETTRCPSCGGTARIAFVLREAPSRFVEADRQNYVFSLHKNEGKGGYWPHDCIAVAVYFCKECFEAVTRWNQA